MEELTMNTTYEVEGPADGNQVEKVAKALHMALRGHPDYINNHILVNYGTGYVDVIIFHASLKEPKLPEFLKSHEDFENWVGTVFEGDEENDNN